MGGPGQVRSMCSSVPYACSRETQLFAIGRQARPATSDPGCLDAGTALRYQPKARCPASAALATSSAARIVPSMSMYRYVPSRPTKVTPRTACARAW